MKPWAKWMINHNLRYVLFFLGLLSLFVVVPIAMLGGAFVFFPELYRDIKAEFKTMMNYPKDTK